MQDVSQSSVLEIENQSYLPGAENPLVCSGFRRIAHCPFERALSIDFLFEGGARGCCLLDDEAANFLFGRVNWSALSDELSVQFIDDRLRSFGNPLLLILSKVRSISDVRIVSTADQRPVDDYSERFELQMSVSDQPVGRCAFFVSTKVVSQTEMIASGISKSDNKVRFMLPVRCEFVGIVDARSSLSSVKPGDVILFDDRQAGHEVEAAEQVKVFALSKYLGLGQWVDQQMVQISDAQPVETDDFESPGSNRLCFEFDHGSVELTELAGIGPNFQLPSPNDGVSSEVRVLVDNGVVGKGQYVRAGSRRGVRILTWSEPA